MPLIVDWKLAYKDWKLLRCCAYEGLMKTDKKYVYGPVPSRRLGRSLGIDIVPFKVCSFDCIYCQLGRTTDKTTELKEYLSAEDALKGVAESLRTIKDPPDYISIAGSGEPTLNSAIGDIVSGIKDMTDIPVAIITNGSLLYMPEVRKMCALADLVLPSLDGGSDESFRRINRPGEGVTLDLVVDGLVKFREEYSGQIWLEVFIVSGINDSDLEVEKLKKCIERIRPDKIQLNTSVRPTAEINVGAVCKARLEEIADMLGDSCEVIADFLGADDHGEFKVKKDDIVEMISRRPCTVEDIAKGLKTHRNDVIKYVEMLLSEGRIEKLIVEDSTFYRALD